MSFRRPLLWALLLASGLGAWVFVSGSAARRQVPAQLGSAPQPGGAQDSDSPPPAAADPRISRLWAMNSKLAERVGALEHDAPGAPEPPASAAEILDARQTALTAQREQYAELVQAHLQAKADGVWAERTSELLSQDLAELSSGITGASLERIDCRNDSCIAELKLDSAVSAQAEAARLASHPYAVNCATRIQLDDAADPEAPYALQIVFHDCQPDPA